MISFIAFWLTLLVLKTGKPAKNIEKAIETNIAKQILDKYATAILRQSAIFEKNGESIPNLNRVEDYTPDKYNGDEVLWIPPKNCIRLEFEHDDTKDNIRCIRECESAASALGFDFCISGHLGGKSPYFNMFNIKGLPVNEDGPIAKSLLIDLMLSEAVKAKLDRSNIGWTYSPVIGHPHWKKKYNGALHTIIRGTNPIDQQNEYPKELLKQIKKSKVNYKTNIVQVQQQYSWVSDFLINYCTKNRLPTGNRNHIIEKNLAILIIHNKNRDKLIAEYLSVQERKHNSLKGWITKVAKGDITEVNVMEIKRYIEENNIPYEIPSKEKTQEEPEEKEEDGKKAIRRQAERRFKDPNFLVDTVKEIQKEVAAEEDTIIAEIIIASTRLVKNAIPESTNLLLSDKTGLGKDWVTKKTLEVIIPEEENIHVTKMTPETFTYWHYEEDDWTWDNKVIHFEDVTQALLNCSTFKTMSSGDNFAVVVKDQKVLEIPIKGKPTMILTSHHANPKDESLRRFRIGGLDETNKQTRNIMDKVSRCYTGAEKSKPDFVIRSAAQSLESYEVIIPFAELLQHFFPDNDIMRTHYRCFLDYICGSTIFHQYQREKTTDGRLVATPDDYMIARVVLIYTTSNPKFIPMSMEYKNIVKILQDYGEPMTVKELDVASTFSQPWFYKHLPNIVRTGIIEKTTKHIDTANKDATAYFYSELTPKMIPTWDELTYQICNILNKTNKTNKTEGYTLLERWFYTHDIKPIKPNPKKDEVFLVLYDHKIPLNREVLSVFSVLYDFLRERDEKRYKKYYEKHEPALYDKIQELKKSIIKNKKAGYKIDDDFLSKNFDSSLLVQLIESGQLIKQPNGEYVWGD